MATNDHDFIDVLMPRGLDDIVLLPRRINESGLSLFLPPARLDFGNSGEIKSSIYRLFGHMASLPETAADWTTDNTPADKYYLEKPYSVRIAQNDGPGLRTTVLNYDNSRFQTPCWFDEESAEIDDNCDPSDFAEELKRQLLASRDFSYTTYEIYDSTYFFYLTRDQTHSRYHWFDWIRLTLPNHQTNAMTAWGHPKLLTHDQLANQFHSLLQDCMENFNSRLPPDNPNRTPRGSQILDHNAAMHPRVVVRSGPNPGLATVMSYNIDRSDDSQCLGYFTADFAVPTDMQSGADIVNTTIATAFANCGLE